MVELEDGNLQCSRSSPPSLLPSFAAHDKGIKSIPAAEPREKLELSLHGALPCARSAEEGFNRTSSHNYRVGVLEWTLFEFGWLLAGLPGHLPYVS